MPQPFRAELIVEPFLTGKRIDTFLARHFRNYSTYRLQRIVEQTSAICITLTPRAMVGPAEARIWAQVPVPVPLLAEQLFPEIKLYPEEE